MRSGLQGDATSRHFFECPSHRFRSRRQLLLQDDFACFIQDAVELETISQIQSNRELAPVGNFTSPCPHSANLLHCRSPFLCASSTSNIGSVSHPTETGLLIPSGKRGCRKL